MKKILTAIILATFSLSALTSCGARNNNSQSNANTTASEPSPNGQAVEIGNLLKDKGIPLIHEVVNTTDSFKDIIPGFTNETAGIISDARTWTEAADITITVFNSVQHRKEARARMEKVPARTYYAECGVIQVAFMPDGSNPNKEAERQAIKTVSILKSAYNCK
jgi:hypothetical protein